MQGILGKIAGVTPTAGEPLEVTFKAACVLPRRTKPPEWLKDQTLTVRRDAADAREVGGPGDSLVLTPQESARWLQPLQVTPEIAHGEVPPRLTVTLRWWKDDKLPEFTVQAGGKRHTGTFTKDGDGGTATVDTAPFFSGRPTLPVTFEVTCDKMTAAAAVLPEGKPFARKVLLPDGERQRMENLWYTVEVAGRVQGGAIAGLREKGRGVDHFREPENRIQEPLYNAGHTDRYKTGWDWSDKMKDAALACAGARREGAATRLTLDGVVDDGQNLRTSVSYTLYDDLPLVLIQRDFHFHKGKSDGDKDKDKDEKVKEPIDDLMAVGLGFRAAWGVERAGSRGSRVLCTEGGTLASFRCAQAGDFQRFGGWRMDDGWAVVEHPLREEYALYLFDRQTPPHLAIWSGPHALTLEPFWPPVPIRAEESVGYAAALTVGERCGAGVDGAWIACRSALPGGGARCGVIARLRDGLAAPSVAFELGGASRETPLERALLPGIGAAWFATADFPDARPDDTYDVTIAGIARRG